jgi:predicted regulator of Ras-like GTPase activity (Roadblock/LC7/MglB family)
MGMQGNLHDMTIADLIQHTCQDNKMAKLEIHTTKGRATLFFKDGKAVHAVSGKQIGEEVVYKILNWREGTFDLEVGIEPPMNTISRSWSSLLLEGARRLDENVLINNENNTETPNSSSQQEEMIMTQKLDDILKEMSAEIPGYVASVVVGMDGLAIASYAKGKLPPDVISAQMTLLLKLVDTSVEKLGAGIVQDNLTTTQMFYILMKHLPDKTHFLGLSADKKTANLGNMRLITKVYMDRISQAIPH